MSNRAKRPAELQNVGRWLQKARVRHGLTQAELAIRAGVSQPRVSGIEKGIVLPTLPQLIRLARALALPLQWFFNGVVTPGREIADIALQLHWLKVVDLLVPNNRVPGAFLPTEQVLALAARGTQPDPRIIEAIPAILAWNPWSASRLREYARPRTSRASIRLAWLGDIALTIHRTAGFPGGCPQHRQLESFVGRLAKARQSLTTDDLGRPGDEHSLPPVSKRWKITYGAPISAFFERAEQLNRLLEQRRHSEHSATQPGDE
jgi:transcriptional regulator with XRE-family HTH domain